MDATGILIYGSMLVAHLALAYILFVNAWGRFMVAAFLLTIGYALLGYTVFPVFGVEPWHTLLTPLVVAADASHFVNPARMQPRAAVGVIFVLVGIGFLVSVVLAGSYRRERKQDAKAECPFDHRGRVCEARGNGKVEVKKEEVWMH